jgi:hypothetical protein
VLFKPTTVQKNLTFFKGGAKHILFFGGFCSGKTIVLVMMIIDRTLRFAGSLPVLNHIANIEDADWRPI